MHVMRRLVGVGLLVASLAVSSTPALAAGRSAKHAPAKHAPAKATPAATYRTDMVSIDAEFSHAVARATETLRRAMAHSRNAADRINARNVYREAIRRATQRREVEVEVLDSSSIGVRSGDGSTPPSDGGKSSSDH